MARTPSLPEDLAEYKAKRDFTRTTEPRGPVAKSRPGQPRRFVVQKHDATRLHWDFRLELDGVLKSWAVTRGPSPDPADKRLAVRTEDHPLDYASFEGTIPEGEYGGGTVMLWDEGTWEPIPGKTAEDLAQGHLHFILHGQRMKGEWLLIRLKPRGKEKRENWLLRKIEDSYCAPADSLTERALTSISTGRSMHQIAAGTAAPLPNGNTCPTGNTGRCRPGRTRLAARNQVRWLSRVAGLRRRQGGGLYPFGSRLDRKIP